MRKYSCALVLLLLALEVPIFAQAQKQSAKSNVKIFENSPGPSPVTLSPIESELVNFEHQFWGAMKSKILLPSTISSQTMLCSLTKTV